ncbi:Glycerol-3-phosphate dehydrogenase (NAD+) [Ceratobasidium theobromae]|uniref:Glycerol-3-phosphate dehydrogenase [NAD(+)] n=1 Tax=Ceratobasidium theobromae TaxID=1582974 RepID=A0A5N5QH81_9AGAM|nr:Glycerol-3-phosphate dehydrogenase (NAD+) [Ceratobasidium theobromae]
MRAVKGKVTQTKRPSCSLTTYDYSVDGLSMDLVALNIVGFSSYTFYTINFLYNGEVRDEYRQRHDGHNNSVQFNDFVFAAHALALALITFFQTLCYPRGPGQRISTFNRGVIAFMMLFVVVDLGRVVAHQAHLLDVLYHLGMFKLYINITKYVPQAFSNFNRQSTEGWSIGGVLLDFTGGVLSFLQLLVDSYDLGGWPAIIGNPVKFGLSVLSLGFDLLFISQHYIFYAAKRSTSHNDRPRPCDNEVAAGESQPLLGAGHSPLRLHHAWNGYKKPLFAIDVSVPPVNSRVRAFNMAKEKVCIIGSGNWGSAIARITGMNVKKHPDIFEEEITMYVHDEEVDGCLLSQLINKKHENVKYLPEVQLGTNIRAEPDPVNAVEGATALIVVLPQQFVEKVLEGIKGHILPQARAVSLIKGVKVEGAKILTFPSVISSILNVRCSALGGANIAGEVAKDNFCESTLGVPPEGMNPTEQDRPSDSDLWYKLFDTPTFRIRVVQDVEGVALCGGLKTLAAGFSDGLGWGSNTKAAIIRIGLMELKDFCLHFYPSIKADTFLQESCGVADIMTSCNGRNRKVAEDMVKKGKGFEELEKEDLGGQSLQGPETADQIHKFLDTHGKEVHQAGGFPLLENVWKICYQGMAPEKLIEGL